MSSPINLSDIHHIEIDASHVAYKDAFFDETLYLTAETSIDLNNRHCFQ